ncbi:MAG: class I SAM-dependent methyltransferase [Ilumatobacter sp.]
MSEAGNVRAELVEFYEEEAASRRRGAPSGRRVEWLNEFVGAIGDARARRVIDLGAGPGTDADAFVDAGWRYIGVDLAPANGALARERGCDVLAGSLFELPFVNDTFDVGWSMSTLMHVPDAEMATALASISRVLRPGSPLAVGQWGGSLGAVYSEREPPGMRRLFDLRSAERNRDLLGSIGVVEHFDVWDTGPDDWEYHAAIVRTATDA